MRVFVCKGCRDGFNVKEVVVAETAIEALKSCLNWYTNSYSEWWDITEVDTTKAGMHEF